MVGVIHVLTAAALAGAVLTVAALFGSPAIPPHPAAPAVTVAAEVR